jgi:hypothetical protein
LPLARASYSARESFLKPSGTAELNGLQRGEREHGDLRDHHRLPVFSSNMTVLSGKPFCAAS